MHLEGNLCQIQFPVKKELLNPLDLVHDDELLNRDALHLGKEV